MAIIKQHHFINANVGVQIHAPRPVDPRDPLKLQEEGDREIIIVDKDSGDTYHFRSEAKVLKLTGQQLLGIGEVEIIGADDMPLSQNGGKRR